VLLTLLSPVAACARPDHFDVQHDAGGYRVDASADLAADPAVVWETLTDYERLPQFVPGIRSVRVLETHEEAGRQRLLIEQSGELRFLFFSRRVEVLLDVEQQPMRRVNARALPRPQPPDNEEVNLDQFEGTYTLEPIPGGVRLGYQAHFDLGSALPRLLVRFALRWTMRAQFDAMLDEIDRRRLALAPQGAVK